MANGSTCTASLLLLLSLFAAPIWTVSLVHVIEISDDYHNVQDAIEEIRAYTCQHHAQIQVRYIFDWEHFRGFSFILTTAHGSDIESDLLSGQLAQHDAVKDFWDLPEQPMPSSSNGRAKDKIGKRASLRTPTIGTFSGDEAVDRSSANSEGFSTNAMTGVNKLHADGIKGKGITIAVLDSCFDYKRDVFGNSIGADKKITYAYNWMSNSSDVYCTCDWHGAAVLGIIAANPTEYNIVGAAPESSIELHAFSGCDLDSGVPNDLIMHILTNVVKRKVDVINLSQNNIPTSRLTPFAVLLSRIQHSGIFVACSGGNSPHPTPFHIQEPATGVGVPAIGSVANTIVPYIFWGGTCSVNGKVRGQLEYIPWGSNDSGPNFPSDLKVWTPSTDRVLSDPGARFYGDCHAAPTALPDWNETILLIGYTDCWNLRNNQTIQNAPGLKYLLQYNNKPSGSVSVVDDNFYTDPRYAGWGVIEWQQASSWVKLNSSGDFSVTLSNDASERRYSPVPNTITGGRVHFWSPWGPNFDASIGPSFLAPGAHVQTVGPSWTGGIVQNTGTSFAAPHVAGCAALIRSLHLDWDANTIRTALALTARPMPNNDVSTKDFGFLAPTQQQGAGLIDCYAAAHSTTLVNVSSLSLTNRQLGNTTTFRITNTAAGAVAYDLHHIPAGSAYTFTDSSQSAKSTLNVAWSVPAAVFDAPAEIQIEPPSIRIAPSESADVTVTLTSPPANLENARVPFFGGYITLNCSASSPATACFDLSLPYAGVAESLYDVDVLPLIALEIISNDGESSLGPAAEGTVFNFTYTKGNITARVWPGFSWSTPLPAQQYIFDLVKYPSDETFLTDERWYLISPWYWDATNANNKFVPAGQYYWRARALRLGGQIGLESDYIVRTTGHFAIRYETSSTGLPSA